MNKFDATYEQACMAAQIDKYSIELYRTITDSNDRNGASFFNEKIQYSIRRVIIQEESKAHYVTVDNFSQRPVTLNT